MVDQARIWFRYKTLDEILDALGEWIEKTIGWEQQEKLLLFYC